MRNIWFLSFVVIAVLCGISGIAFRSHAEGANLRGEYVEARTASVFAGACHYNGELTTTGRDALMAWNVTSGRWKGVDLAGVRAMAIVSSDANLAEINAAHRSEVLIDSAASEAQATALVDALKTKYTASLGAITSVRRTPIEFNHEGATFTASAEKLASIDVDAMPNDECCKMPNLVWYSPLAPLLNRKVGYTQKVRYAGGSVGESWERAGENSAFYGNFAF
jgi:hypothetical protein